MGLNPGFAFKLIRKQFFLIMVLPALFFGCAGSLERQHPLPGEFKDSVRVMGLNNIRMWGDEFPVHLGYFLSSSGDEIKTRFAGIMNKEHHYLALSGGGTNGAYGAGILCGWTQAGNRPEFTIVTGVSTGALIAPFAFLGPGYDSKLKELYTIYSDEDLVVQRSIFNIFPKASAAKIGPFREVLSRYIDRKMMMQIAAEHKKGRILLIGTTNLDALRPVVWNIGSIAASGSPGALELIRSIIIASGTIPGVFPPALIPVEMDGIHFDEMHVDGGVSTQVFFYPLKIDWKEIADKLGVKGKPNLYVIRNSKLKPEWESVEPKIIPILDRSMTSLIRTQGMGDLLRLYTGSQRDNHTFKLAYIPDGFEAKSTGFFDPEYMTMLFDLGFEKASGGYPWENLPPQLKP